MSKNSKLGMFIKQHWKLLLNIVTIVALLLFVYVIHEQLFETIKNFKRVNGWVLALVIPIEVLNYHAQAKMYKNLFDLSGTNLSYKKLLKLSLELNFVNHVFPSGGVTGLSYFTLRLRSEKVRASTSTLVQAMKLFLVFLSFEVLLVLGMFFLAIDGKASNMTILIGSTLSTLLIVGTAVFVYIVGSKQRIEAFLTAMTTLLNKIIQIVRPKYPETINIAKARKSFGEFHDDYNRIRTQGSKLKAPFWWAMVANVTEIAVVLVVFIAFGQYANIGAVILAYAVANFAGLVSVLPGGVGIYEVLMTTVLATAGVPASVSLPAIVMYRVVNTIIQVPPGYYFYHRSLISGKAKPVELNAT